MKMIQEWLGYSVFQTTANRYSHLATDAKNIVADTIAGKLAENETKPNLPEIIPPGTNQCDRRKTA